VLPLARWACPGSGSATWANLTQQIPARKQIRSSTFGQRNVPLHLNTGGWSMLLAGKLFRICQPESFWQPSGRKDSKIQDRRAISGKIVQEAERMYY